MWRTDCRARSLAGQPEAVKQLHEQYGTLSPVHTVNNLALLYNHQERYDDAEPLYLETLEIRKRLLGDDHPDTLISMSALAKGLSQQGRLDEAADAFLGTQGYAWDTQSDMFLALIGAVLALALLGRIHDRQLADLAKDL